MLPKQEQNWDGDPLLPSEDLVREMVTADINILKSRGADALCTYAEAIWLSFSHEISILTDTPAQAGSAEQFNDQHCFYASISIPEVHAQRPNAEYMYFIFSQPGFGHRSRGWRTYIMKSLSAVLNSLPRVSLSAYVFAISGHRLPVFFRLMLISRLFIIVVLTIIPLALLLNQLFYFFAYQYLERNDRKRKQGCYHWIQQSFKKLVNYLSEDGINEVVGFLWGESKYPWTFQLSYPQWRCWRARYLQNTWRHRDLFYHSART